MAEQLSRILGQDRVFYDRYYEAELARRNLDTYPIKIYQDDTHLTRKPVVFVEIGRG
jgi:hypothetical protein